jgi:hypothetical protein
MSATELKRADGLIRRSNTSNLLDNRQLPSQNARRLTLFHQMDLPTTLRSSRKELLPFVIG